MAEGNGEPNNALGASGATENGSEEWFAAKVTGIPLAVASSLRLAY